MPATGTTQPRVWIVHADHWPRAYLRAELIERGYDATGFETLGDAILRRIVGHGDRPDLLVADLSGGLDDLDEKRRAFFVGERIPIVAIVSGGERSRAGTGTAVVETLHRPLTIGAIADAVDRQMGRAAPNPAAGLGR